VSNTVTENFSQRSQAGEEVAHGALAPHSDMRVRINAHPAVESDSSDISTDSIMEGIRNNQMQTGRKPVPFAEYLTTRQLKIDHLQKLSDDKNLSVKERKRYRAQKYALQKRLQLKLKAHRKAQAQAAHGVHARAPLLL